MGSYNLLRDHGINTEDTDDLSVSAHWIMLVVRYAEPLTSSKARLAARTPLHTGNISLDDDIESLNRTKQSLLITSDCVRLDIDSSKGRYTQSLQATLVPGHHNYLSEVMPGDWVFAWMMNSREAFDAVIEKIGTNKPANSFEDGLKFVGRVQDVRKVLMQSPQGLRTVQYHLQAVGFGELDSSVFFDPNLSRNEQYIERVLQNLSIPMRGIFNAAAEAAQKGEGGIDINKIMPALIKAFIGEGIYGIATQAGGLDLAQGAAVTTQDAPFAYVIPDGVAALLGVQVPSKASGIYSYADILETIIGLQKHEDHSFPEMFFPSGTRPDADVYGPRQYPPNRHVTARPLKGIFLTTPTSFDNKSVWNLLNEFLNPAINEMYTAVKLTPAGRVMPTLVVRQLPFTSPVLAAKYGEKVTSFHELPRWKAPPVLVRGMDVGRSDGERINFVHIYGQTSRSTMATDMANQLVRNPPISDLQDIKRHGLRPHMGMANVSPVDTIHGGPGEWMTLRADFLMGQHLMLTGICSLVGVTAPIAPGDNLEFDDTLFHIEAVHHHCEINPQGEKTFTTQASLSHGVRNDVPIATARIPAKKKVTKKGYVKKDLLNSLQSDYAKASDEERGGEMFTSFGGLDAFEDAQRQYTLGLQLEVLEGGGNPDVYLYSGIHEEDNATYDPGHTVEEE